METKYNDDELDTIIREIIGVERKILLETGNSVTARTKKVKEIIERRAKKALENDT